jgi:two-component system response regulator YesN
MKQREQWCSSPVSLLLTFMRKRIPMCQERQGVRFMHRIVIVDVAENTAKTIKQMNIWQARKDFKLVAVETDEECAMDYLGEMKPDIVCVVTNYRNVQNIALIRHIRRRFPDIHLILIGEDSSYEQVRAGFLAGAFDYLVRPVSEEEFDYAISRIYEEFGKQYVWEKISLKVDALIENIFLGGGNTDFICESILDQIYSDWDNDAVNGQVVGERAKNIIYDELIKRKPWLEKFIYDKHYTYQMGFHVKEKEAIKREWKRDFAQAAKVVKKYQMLDHKLIYHIGKYVVVHVDEHLTLEDISKGVFLNRSYISHVFKKVAGIHFIDFITDVKIDRAKILLMDEDRKIWEVAATIGYHDAEYFSKVFKNRTGFSPSRYRESLKI